MTEMTPNQIFDDFKSGRIAKEATKKCLLEFIENSEVEQVRVDAISRLISLEIDAKELFKLLESLLISDNSSLVREKSLELIGEEFSEKSLNLYKQVIDQDISARVFSALYKRLEHLEGSLVKELREKIIEKYSKSYLIVLEEVPFLIDLDEIAFRIWEGYDYKLEDRSDFHFLELYNDSWFSGLIAHETVDFWPRCDGECTRFLVKFGHIVAVDASRLKLKKIPRSIKLLRYLKGLILKDNELEDLSEDLASCRYLERLYLGGNKLKKLPQFLENFKHLRELYVKDCPTLEEISDSMWACASRCFVKKYVDEGVRPEEAPVLSLLRMMVGRLDRLSDDYYSTIDIGYAWCTYKIDDDGHVTTIWINDGDGWYPRLLVPEQVLSLPYLSELYLSSPYLKISEKFLKRLEDNEELRKFCLIHVNHIHFDGNIDEFYRSLRIQKESKGHALR